MRNRLVGCVAGALIGFALGGTIRDMLGLTATIGTVFSAAAGMVLGYVATTLVDVFRAKPDSLLPGRSD